MRVKTNFEYRITIASTTTCDHEATSEKKHVVNKLEMVVYS